MGNKNSKKPKDWKVNIGAMQISDKGVETKTQLKVGYEDEYGGFGGGSEFDNGVYKSGTRADATINGKKYGVKVLFLYKSKSQ